MGFATPIYLLLLIPWAGAVVWVLLGRTNFARVPTTQFWEETEIAAAPRRALRKPPGPIVMMLIAALLGILAAGDLGYADPARGQRITVIVDRGLSTAAAIAKNPDDVPHRLIRLFPLFTPVDLALFPGDGIRSTDLSDILSDFRQLRGTALDTSTTLEQRVRRELARNDQMVVVVTAQALDVIDPRVRVIAPSVELSNAGIALFAVSEGSKPQAMVRVLNGSSSLAGRSVTLRVDAVEQKIVLPVGGETKDIFFDLPALGATSVARLDLKDDILADDVSYLAQRRAWPSVAVQSALPPALSRLIEIYARQRPAGPASRRILVADAKSPLPAGVAGVVLKSPGAGAKLRFAPASTENGHPLVRDIAWQRLVKGATAQPPVGNGWRTIVRAEEQVLVAVREQPARQVWVGIESPGWELEADYVVFWTNVFDWVGGGVSIYENEPAREVPADWKRVEPVEALAIDAALGVYQSPDGLRALVAPAVDGAHLAALAKLGQPERAAPVRARGVRRTLAPALLVLALAALVAGVWGVRGRDPRLTPI